MDASYDHEIDVIRMPELWYTKLVKDCEKEFGTIIGAACEYNVTIDRSNSRFNCLVLKDTFSLRYKPGSKIEIFDCGNFRFCVVVCYDVVFPEIARSAASNRVDMLFCTSKILKEGVYSWHMVL